MGLYQLITTVYNLFLTVATAGVGVAATRMITEELALGGGDRLKSLCHRPRQHHCRAGLPQAQPQGGGEHGHNKPDAQQLLPDLCPGGQGHPPPGHKIPLEIAAHRHRRQAKGQDTQRRGGPEVL